MFLKSLNLTNFRNFETLKFQFSQPITLFIGNNAQGKSNILESVFYLANLKSLRVDKDEELIMQGKDFAYLQGEINESLKDPQALISLETAMSLEPTLENSSSLRKKVKVNGVPRRALDYIGLFPVVLFSPEDINLITGSPSLRRSHLDLTLCQINKEYKKSLNSYNEIIVRRNRVLKNIQEGISQKSEVDFWTDRMLDFGLVIASIRQNFFQSINNSQRRISDYCIIYLENILSRSRLQEYQNKEFLSGISLIGPHRDDYYFESQGKDLAKFGSRGEQRTAILDYKISQVNYIEQTTNKRPLLLLDDIFSELDQNHNLHVLELITKQQTIIAAVELDDYLKHHLPKGVQIVSVKQGKLRSSNLLLA